MGLLLCCLASHGFLSWIAGNWWKVARLVAVAASLHRWLQKAAGVVGRQFIFTREQTVSRDTVLKNREDPEQSGKRIIEWLRLEGTSGYPLSSSSCLKWDQRGCSGLGIFCFWHLQGWRLHSHSRQSVPVYNHSYGKIFFSMCFCYVFFYNMLLCWKGRGWCALPPACLQCVGCWKSCSQRCLNLCSLQDRRNLNKYKIDPSADVSRLKWISLPNWVNLNVCWMSLEVVNET